MYIFWVKMQVHIYTSKYINILAYLYIMVACVRQCNFYDKNNVITMSLPRSLNPGTLQKGPDPFSAANHTYPVRHASRACPLSHGANISAPLPGPGTKHQFRRLTCAVLIWPGLAGRRLGQYSWRSGVTSTSSSKEWQRGWGWELDLYKGGGGRGWPGRVDRVLFMGYRVRQ